MNRLARLALVAALPAAGMAASTEAAAATCYAPYTCVSSYNACKQPCNTIKH